MAAKTQGLHHIGLTVPNLAETKAFFIDVLGYQQLGEIADYPAVFLSDGATMLTLWQAKVPNPTPFDRTKNVGLHHFAMKVENDAALSALHETLKTTRGVTIDFAPEDLGGGPTRHFAAFIPGGVRMEFIALGG